MRVRARPVRGLDGADSSGLRVASGANCAKDASAEPSMAAAATIMTAARLMVCPRPLTSPTLAHCSTAVNVGAVVRAKTANALAGSARSPKTAAMAGPTFADPLAWRTVKAPSLAELEGLAEEGFRRLPEDCTAPRAWRTAKAPSLAELEGLAEEAFRRLPQKFHALCEGLVIRVEDFPTEEVLDELGAESEFDVLGLFQGVGLPFPSHRGAGQMAHMVWRYRRPS